MLKPITINQTARNDLNDLVEKKFLQPRKSGHKIQFLPANKLTVKYEQHG
jgi:Fic family protein